MKKTPKFLLFSFLILWISVFFMISTAAYIDPSVMTYAVQAIAGVAIASSVVIFAFWRKAKRKIKKTLGIDENAGKEIEEDIIDLTENAEEKEHIAK